MHSSIFIPYVMKMGSATCFKALTLLHVLPCEFLVVTVPPVPVGKEYKIYPEQKGNDSVQTLIGRFSCRALETWKYQN